MSDFLSLWLAGFCTGIATAGILLNVRRRGSYRSTEGSNRTRDCDPDWRRSFSHENINRPTTPKPDLTPKPQFPPPQIIREDFLE